MGKEELPFSVPGEETVALLSLGGKQRKLCKDRTYKDFLSPSPNQGPPPFGWGSPLSVPRSLLLGLSLRSGPSSLLLSPSPSHTAQTILLAMVTGPGRFPCQEAKATIAVVRGL